MKGFYFLFCCFKAPPLPPKKIFLEYNVGPSKLLELKLEFCKCILAFSYILPKKQKRPKLSHSI